MSYFEDIMDNLKQNEEVPPQVLAKLDAVLENLPDYEYQESAPKKVWTKAVAAAAVLITGIVICYSNPALASKIPLIGRIFAKIEQEVPFSGNYSEKADSLVSVVPESVPNQNSADTISPNLSVTDAGITLTAAEVYCDGISVFLTAQVYAEQGGFLHIPSHHIINREDISHLLYLEGDWKLSEDVMSQPMENLFVEGKIIDDHTFVGMIKFDLDTNVRTQDTLSLQLSVIGWDDTTIESTETLSAAHQIDGHWNLEIPFQADLASTKEFEVNETRDGYTIRKLFVSPYQVVSYVDAPVTYINKKITRTDYEQKLGLAQGEEASDMSYEDYVAMQTTKRQECETVICNQAGELLAFGDMAVSTGKTTFAVDGKSLTTLYIYVFTDYEDYQLPNGTIDMDTAAQKAVVTAVVDIQ